MPSRDPKKQGNDEDYVPATHYPKIIKGTKVPELPNNQSLPHFDPLPIHNDCPDGQPNLPPGFDDSDTRKLFGLFFTDELMDLLIYHTNANAARAKSNPQKRSLRKTARIYLWKDTSRPEMYAYFGVLIYMGLHKEPAIVDYWKKGDEYNPQHPIGQYISKDRFLAIDQYLYCEDPGQSATFTTPFERIWDVSEYLRKACHRYYTPGTHLTIDESIKRFTGRAKEIVNIPSKPTPEGFKIWILANEGYVLDWLFHAKGQGPYELDTYWTKKEGFTPTEAVVLDLLLRKQEGQPRFCPNRHTVWVDNLFSSVKLFERLRREGIGAAGTVRTSRTKREEDLDRKESKKQSGVVKRRRGRPRKNAATGNMGNSSQNSQVSSQNPSQDHQNLPTPEPSQEPLGLSGNLIQNGQFYSEVLSQSTQFPAQDPPPNCTKEPFSQKLMNIKLYHTDDLQWGELYWDVSKNKTVLQAAWKDAQVVLFASTVARPGESIMRERKRPAKTSTNSACTRLVFGDLAVKVLPIPLFIDLYNHFMNGVDRFDQTTSYYSTQRAKRKTWKPLWFFLFNLVLYNCYRLSSFFGGHTKTGGHRKFLESLIKGLFDSSAKPIRKDDRTPSMRVNNIQIGPHGPKPTQLGKKRTCSACAAAGRKRRRVALEEVSPNAPRRTPQTNFGCELCKIPLCQTGECWEEHLKQVILARSIAGTTVA